MASHTLNKFVLTVLFILTSSYCVYCGRDAVGPIELIPREMEDDASVTIETRKLIKDEVSMRELFKEIDEKLFKPNFENVIRHMDRFTRAILKLDARVDSIHNQMEDIRQHSANCSTVEQINRLQANVALSLDDLDQKLDQIDRQMKLSSASSVRATIEDINQRTKDLQSKFHHQTTVKSSDTDANPRLQSLEEKYVELRHDLDPLRIVPSHLESINRTLTEINNKSDKAFQDANKFDSVLSKVEDHGKSISKVELLMEQNNDAHYKWFGNLIGMFNDGIDRIEAKCLLEKVKLDEKDSSKPLVTNAVHSCTIVEHQMETVLHKIENLERNSLGLYNKPNSSKHPTNIASSDWHECSLILPLLTQLSDTLGFKFDQIQDVCYKDEGILTANLKIFNEKLDHISNQIVSSELLNNLDMKSNMTHEKLNYMTSVLTLLQLDQATIGMNTAELVRRGDNNSQIHNVAQELQMVKQLLHNSSQHHHHWSKINHALNKIEGLLLRQNGVEPTLGTDSIQSWQLPSDLSYQVEKISNSLDQCLTPKKEQDRLAEQNANNLQDLKEALMHQTPIQLEYNQILQKVESRLVALSHKMNSLTSESVERLTTLLEETRNSKNDSFLSDLEMATKVDIIYQRISDDTSFSILNKLESDIRTLLIQLHPLMDLPSQLYNFTVTQKSHQTSVTSDIDSFFWSRTSHVLDTMSELQQRMEEKFNKLRASLQNTVDDGMVEIVDILGQNKAWLQQTAKSFVSQHSDNLSNMKESVSTLVAKGFDNLHFMYQYLNGKLDQIHLIASHNMEDCADVFKSGQTTSGVYIIYPRNSKEMRVYCDMETEGGGWTVIQRRDDREMQQPRISFNRTWQEYKYGFGNLEYEFWLGNENVHILTHQNNYMLRIDMSYAEPHPQMPQYKRKFWHDLSNDSKSLYAQYSHFRIRSEHFNYSLNFDKYMGIHPYDGLEGRLHSIFTTYDHATDINLEHCAKIQGGGWWYGNECFRYALNSKPKKYYWEDGSLFTGITWGGTADFALLKLVEMKIIPMNVYQSSLIRNV